LLGVAQILGGGGGEGADMYRNIHLSTLTFQCCCKLTTFQG
jgi:hypothetical protein